MKPAPFDYVVAASADEAVQYLAEVEDGTAKIIAGGQSLVPLLALRLARPSLLVDINRIPGLATIESLSKTSIRIGALVSHRMLCEQTTSPLLSEAASWIGHTAIRTRGTIGGSLAHSDPAAELPVVAVAAGMSVEVVSPSGKRTISAEDLFVSTLENSLADDEMIVAVDAPLPERWGFAEYARRHGDFGLVTVAVAEVGGKIRIAIGGVGNKPVRALESEALVNDATSLDTQLTERAARAAASAVTPNGDFHGSASYRTGLVEELVGRALRQLALSRLSAMENWS
ncbi:MAG: xanthine dehydrogenase family protein subunit M [Acidimicrobiaceae bacterium]|nr:xanthine dehydrogenase family protein subunit M [Acidimicrobiaceae bacterium]